MSDAAFTLNDTRAPHVPVAAPSDYFALLKPRVMSRGDIHGVGGHSDGPHTAASGHRFCTLLSIAVGAGASGALNMWYDADIDALMTRTKSRPIPAGRLTREEALAFGLVLAGMAVFTRDL